MLGPEYAGRTMLVEYQDGRILLTPAVVVPEYEAWLFQSKEALASVQRGLRQASGRELVSNPEFDAMCDQQQPDDI